MKQYGEYLKQKKHVKNNRKAWIIIFWENISSKKSSGLEKSDKKWSYKKVSPKSRSLKTWKKLFFYESNLFPINGDYEREKQEGKPKINPKNIYENI